jgi:dTDP-4-amino-4,6-dideoxygalactose transaminase
MFQVILPGDRKRSDVMEEMKSLGIGTGVHYPAVHLFALYRRMGWKDGDFPNAEHAGRSILTLPLFPAMARSDVARVVRALATTLRGHAKA